MKSLKLMIISLVLTAVAIPALGDQQRPRLPQSAYLKSAKIAMYAKEPRLDEAMNLLDSMLYYYGPAPEAYFMRGNIIAERADNEQDLGKKTSLFAQMSANYDSVTTSCGSNNVKSNLKGDCKRFEGLVDSVKVLYWRKHYIEGGKVMDRIDKEINPRIQSAADSLAADSAKQELQAAADTAISFFEISRAVNPADYRSYEGLGLIYDREKKYDSSIAWFEKAASMQPDSGYLTLDVAYGYIQLSDWDNAINSFKKYLAKNPNDAGILFNLAICYNNKKEFDSSYAYDMRTIQASDTMNSAYVDVGQYFLLSSQTYSDSAQEYKQKDDKSPTADKFLKMRDAALDSSSKYFSIAAQRQPDNVAVLKQLFIVLWARGDFKQAAEVCQKLTQVDPNDKDNWINLGDIYIQEQKFSDAIPAFEKATEVDPGDVKIWEKLKELYTNSNMPDKAKKADDKIAELNKL